MTPNQSSHHNHNYLEKTPIDTVMAALFTEECAWFHNRMKASDRKTITVFEDAVEEWNKVCHQPGPWADPESGAYSFCCDCSIQIHNACKIDWYSCQHVEN